MNNKTTLYQQAIVAMNAGNFIDAERSFRGVLQSQPEHIGALNLLTVVLMAMERYSEAEEFIRTATEIGQSSEVSFYNYGIILKKLGRPREALDKFSFALRLKPDLSETWNNRGTVFNDLGEYQNAISDFDKAITLNKNQPDAYINKGKALSLLKRHNDAFAAYDRALALKPDSTEAWLGRGNVYADLKRYDEAFAAFDKALALKPDLAEAWRGRGNVYADLKRHNEALAAFDKALALKPELAEAWLGRGNVYADLKRYDEAFAAFSKALALKPDLAEAWLGRGNVFAELRCSDDALVAFDKALALKPDLAEAWRGRGYVFIGLKDYNEAFAAFDKSLALQPDTNTAEGARLHCKMHLCNWTNFGAECEHLISAVKDNKINTDPFSFLSISTSPEDQIACAKLWAHKIYPDSDKPLWRGEIYRHKKIRVAYVSADLHQHAIPYLIAGMFEQHDKSRFELTALSIGPDDMSEIRQRMKRSFNRFIDARNDSDDEIASQIKGAEIDILVDLNGFTRGGRTGIFARRPAPIQVNYLGYPGTLGADYIDYLIADHTVVPESTQGYYTEKIAYVPHSYQANDAKRPISSKRFTRAGCELPENAFVFCCFNNNYKIIPDVFDCWMRILHQAKDSVLWLLESNATAASNLRKEAAARGIDAERLVFAPYMPQADHLARLRLADLCLDTRPYNAHTTASDALWAGLPVLTQAGETFAARVGASLLNAIGLPELITSTRQEYAELAIELATKPEKLAAIKNKLSQNRLTKPLFNTQLFTQHIEQAYEVMYERYQANSPPENIYVPR